MSRSLHHIALGARDVEAVAAFYREVFGLEEIARHDDDDDEAGELRSIWLDMKGPILMVERTVEDRGAVQGVGAGPFLLAFTVTPEERIAMEGRLGEHGGAIEDRTGFTSYARDPEGNRVAISHYPHTPHTPHTGEPPS